MANDVSGFALGAAAAGAVLVYGGITGRSPLKVVQAVVKGSGPSSAPMSALPGGVLGSAAGAAIGGATGGVGGGRIDVGGGSVGPQVASFLRGDLGMSRAGAAGWLGNFQWESGMTTTAGNAAEGAIGLAQWEGGRRDHLRVIAARLGLTETDLRAQLTLLRSEIRGADAGAASAYLLTKNARDPRAAAITVDRLFERSDQSRHTERADYAQQWYDRLAA